MKLLVDIGNSLINLGVYQENQKLFYEQLSSNINVDKLLSCMEEVLEPFLLKIQRCVVSNVKSKFNSVIELLVEKILLELFTHW
ncbi:type III pantothenate kinase [Spiroplasma endosymbiont of Agriotes lineatus]|uniref:type III pantothenate kinase n=1 Tax=Spiroplasma endosymbiont of Agriotes lineatus TaxID=3077930 RepID=UPI0030CDA0AA